MIRFYKNTVSIFLFLTHQQRQCWILQRVNKGPLVTAQSENLWQLERNEVNIESHTMSQDNKNLMLPTEPPTWLRAMNELCDLSNEVLNALVFLCRKPRDNPQTSSAVRVSWALLHGVWYMKHHTAPQLLGYFIAIAAQPASSTVFFFEQQQQFFFFLYFTLVRFVAHLRPLQQWSSQTQWVQRKCC